MRIQDFMVGDYLQDQNGVIIQLTEGMFVRYMNDENTFNKLFKPIELEDDIICKNFTTTPEYAYIGNNSVYFRYIFDYGFYNFVNNDKRFYGKLNYVHELQQLFRVFGINKEIKL